jgi:urease accessory protein
LFPEAVLINTAGGLTGGDQIAYDIELEPGSRLTVSGQAAEKIYRSVGTTATIDTHLDIGTGAYLEWLPQETILFEKSKLRRLNRVHLATGSCFLAVEATIFGRTAYGESLRNISVRDGWKIWRDDQLIWFDNFALDGDLESVVGRPAVLGGAKAMATILLADPDIVTCPEFMRKAAEECGERAAVTCRNGLSIMRVFGKDGYGLRRAVAGILTIIRSELAGYPVALPRVWENQ